MKTEITLEELLKQIRTLPLKLAPAPFDRMDVTNRLEKAYLIHCANVLPELVKALSEANTQLRVARKFLPKHGTFGEEGISEFESAQKTCHLALSRAEKVTLP